MEPEEKKEENPTKLKWPPLESDPKIFNDYFHTIGLPSGSFFKELIFRKFHTSSL